MGVKRTAQHTTRTDIPNATGRRRRGGFMMTRWALAVLPTALLFALVLVTGYVAARGAGNNSFGVPSQRRGVFLDLEDENPYRSFNTWANDLLMPRALCAWMMDKFGWEWGYYGTTYLRDYLFGTLLYYGAAGLWHLGIYKVKGKEYFVSKDAMPTREVIVDQMQLAQASMTLYAALPIFAEWAIESGYTRTYFYPSEVGSLGLCFAYWCVYMVLVEVGIYWMHRTLHTNKLLYKHVHALHHKYNKTNTLSPWASIAFNPLDGVLQASPYVLWLFFVPVNYFVFVAMMFFTSVWSTNIHDTLHGDSEPIMGSKYHTVHHTHYMYNYGQFFTFCDRFWGTLRRPEDIKDYRCNGVVPQHSVKQA